MLTFFSPRAYRNGVLVMTLAGSYLAVVALLVAGAALGGEMSEAADGGFLSGFAMLATIPLSFVVLSLYTVIATAQGIPTSEQYPGWWMLAALALCGVVNAVVFWLVFRGRRQVPLVDVPPGTPHPGTATNDRTIT